MIAPGAREEQERVRRRAEDDERAHRLSVAVKAGHGWELISGCHPAVRHPSRWGRERSAAVAVGEL